MSQSEQNQLETQAHILIEMLQSNQNVYLSPIVSAKLIQLLLYDEDYLCQARELYMLKKYYEDPNTPADMFSDDLVPGEIFELTRTSLRIRRLLRKRNWLESCIDRYGYEVTKTGIQYILHHEQNQSLLAKPKQVALNEGAFIEEYTD